MPIELTRAEVQRARRPWANTRWLVLIVIALMAIVGLTALPHLGDTDPYPPALVLYGP